MELGGSRNPMEVCGGRNPMEVRWTSAADPPAVLNRARTPQEGLSCVRWHPSPFPPPDPLESQQRATTRDYGALWRRVAPAGAR